MRHNFIRKYTSPDKLIREHFSDHPEWLAMRMGEVKVLRHALDFESIELYLVDRTVYQVDTVSGNVLAETPIDEFFKQSIEWAREEADV